MYCNSNRMRKEYYLKIIHCAQDAIKWDEKKGCVRTADAKRPPSIRGFAKNCATTRGAFFPPNEVHSRRFPPRSKFRLRSQKTPHNSHFVRILTTRSQLKRATRENGFTSKVRNRAVVTRDGRERTRRAR